MPTGKPTLLIAWTTVAHRADAERLSEGIISRALAACVQIEGPIRSCYRWQGKLEQADEFRLTVKFLESQQNPLQSYIETHHPYDTPEWVVVRAENVGEKYLSWAEANSSNRPL